MKNFFHTIFNTNEIYNAAKRIYDAIVTALADDAYVVKICKKLESAMKDLAIAMGKALNSEFTPVLIEKDENRDKSFIGLRDYTSAYSHSFDPVKAAAAIYIAKIISDIGATLYSFGYAKETAKLNALFERMDTADATQSMEKYGATEWYAELKTRQQEFDAAYKNKSEVEAQINLPLVKESKSRIIKNIDALLNYIENNVELDPAKFGPVAATLDEIITDTVAIARARNTKEANADKETPEK